MQRTRTLTLLVVLAVALAGCTSVGPDAAETDTAVDPGGDEELSITDTEQRLRAAGSFTTDWSYTVTDVDGTTTMVTDTHRVDLTTNRSYERFTTSGASGDSEVETYIADGTSYSRVSTAQGEMYQLSENPPNVFESATGRSAAIHSDLEDDAQFTGTETYDGVTVSRYEFADADAWSEYNSDLSTAAFSSTGNVTITDFEIAVLVDEDGVARFTTFTVSGETDDGTEISAEWRYSVTDLGSTTVEEPGWLDEADQS